MNPNMPHFINEVLDMAKCAKVTQNLNLELMEMEELIICPICNIPFRVTKYSNNFRIHMVKFHNGKFCNYSTKACNNHVYFNKEKLKNHETSCKPFECDKCDKGFRQKCSLNRHIANVHQKRKKLEVLYSCDICEKTFGKRFNLLRHHDVKHMKPSSDTKNRQKSDFSVSCLKCYKPFQNIAGLREHLTKKHDSKLSKYQCNHCLNDISFGSVHNICSKLNFLCSVCDELFDTMVQFMEHKITLSHDHALAFCVENGEVTNLVMKQPDNFGTKEFHYQLKGGIWQKSKHSKIQNCS